MNNITELNVLIYAGAKLVCDKIGVPLKNMNRNSKPGWEIWLETQINVQQQTNKARQRKTLEYVGTERKIAIQ